MMTNYPLSTLILGLLGILTAIPGLASLTGMGQALHPVLEDPMAGLAFVVSAIALLGSAAFPLVMRRLADAD